MPGLPLWWTEPARATSLSKVTAVAGDWFTLDRTLFAPTSRRCRHPQPCDLGEVLLRGTKRKLTGVHWRDGDVWHRCRGWTPAPGDALQCHLDADRRLGVSRAHTAMHLLVAALARHGAVLARDPEVKLGGTVRLDLVAALPATALAAARKQVLAWRDANLEVRHEGVDRALQERVLTAQPFMPSDPYPGPPDVAQAVRIGDACAYPCDGTHVARTSRITDVAVAEARPTRAGFLVVARVA